MLFMMASGLITAIAAIPEQWDHYANNILVICNYVNEQTGKPFHIKTEHNVLSKRLYHVCHVT